MTLPDGCAWMFVDALRCIRSGPLKSAQSVTASTGPSIATIRMIDLVVLGDAACSLHLVAGKTPASG